LHSATTTPEILDVPDLTYFMIDGSGCPGTPEFEAAIKAIYQVSYGVVGEAVSAARQGAMPLEALWQQVGGVHPGDRVTWHWTLLLLPPPLAAQDIEVVFDRTVSRLRLQVPELPVDDVYVQSLSEGRCVQAIHVGPYQDETGTVLRMLAHADANGYAPAGRRHHEIYLSDPERVAPEWLRTIIRVPLTQAVVARPRSKNGDRHA
jgi:hypothetical protein